MIHHVGFEVSDLPRSARFYDAVCRALGWRRLREAPGLVGWGVVEPVLFVTARSRPAPHYGHLALTAAGKAAVDAAHAAGVAAGGWCDGPPGPRPRYGSGYYAAYLRDPDGLRVELVVAHRSTAR